MYVRTQQNQKTSMSRDSKAIFANVPSQPHSSPWVRKWERHASNGDEKDQGANVPVNRNDTGVKGQKTCLASTKWTSLANTQERQLKGELAACMCGSHSRPQEENTERLSLNSPGAELPCWTHELSPSERDTRDERHWKGASLLGSKQD